MTKMRNSGRSYNYRIIERKRSLSIRSRSVCMIVSTITLSVSFIVVVAFQQSLHVRQSRSRFPTASRVLTDPNNLITIEKNIVSDRAALEELYILSSLSKESIMDSTIPSAGTIPKKTRPKRRMLNESKIVDVRPVELFIDEDIIATHKVSLMDEAEDKENIKIAVDAVFSATTSKVQFKGLTTGPSNKRNRNKAINKDFLSDINDHNVSSSGIKTSGSDDDEYIRSILRKKEESFSDDKTIEKQLSSASPSKDIPSDKGMSQHNNSLVLSSEEKRMKSRSSTMPGFKERTNTNRLKAYRDGIKLAEQQSGSKFVDSDAAKKKRRKLNGKDMYKTSASVPESLMQFANEIHEVDRITPKEEITLGEKTQEAIKLQNIYDGLLANLDRDPTDDEWCAAAGKFNMESLSQTIEEGLEAKNKLVTSNLRMVQGVVNVYIRNGLKGQYNAGDLMQEGILALIRAAEKFDPDRGFRFSTYAMYWIRSAIKRDQLSQSRVVPVPQRLHEKHKRINLIRYELKESLNRQPTKSELSKAVGMSEVQIERCETAISQKFYSLDQNMVNRMKPNSLGENTDSMHSIIESKTDVNELDLDQVLLREDLVKALQFHLSDEAASMIMLRFGMDTKQSTSKRGGRTISEVSNLVGLKPDKVRRTINRSLKQLQVLVGDDFQYYYRDLHM